MNTKLTATATFTVRDATGPNPEDLALEVIDSDGDRLAYVESIDAAADEIQTLLADSGTTFEVD